MRGHIVKCLLSSMTAVYRVMLLAYPSEFRRRFYNDMIQVFIDDARETTDARGLRGLLGMTVRVGIDFIASTMRERIAVMKRATQQSMVKWLMLSGVLVSCGMIFASIALYRPYLAMDQSMVQAIEPMAVLVLYGIIATWIPMDGGRWQRTLLSAPLNLGIVTGMLGMAHIFSGNFVDFGRWNGTMTLSVMAISFMLWGVAGYSSARGQSFPITGVIAGAWSGMVCSVIVVTSGLALELFIHPPAENYVVTWGEFKRSGWSDVHAFRIANTLESGFEQLFLSPIIGAVFGGVAGLFARQRPYDQSTNLEGRRVANPSSR